MKLGVLFVLAVVAFPALAAESTLQDIPVAPPPSLMDRTLRPASPPASLDDTSIVLLDIGAVNALMQWAQAMQAIGDMRASERESMQKVMAGVVACLRNNPQTGPQVRFSGQQDACPTVTRALQTRAAEINELEKQINDLKEKYEPSKQK